MASVLPLPPVGTLYIDPKTGTISETWRRYLLALEDALGSNVAPIDAQYWVSTSNTELENERDIGALSTGYLKITTALGVATPSSTPTVPASDLTGVVAAANGGTGQSSYTVGDLLYASGAAALSKLIDVATGNALLSGGVATAPAWGKVGLTTHVSGTLPVGNGGTGLASLTASRVPYGNGTSAFQSAADFTFDGTTFTTAGQIAFPATQNPSTNVNTLDDYEEGTFMPTIGGSGGQSGQVYGQQQGAYIKIGKRVIAEIFVQLSTLGTITDTVQIQDLPFTVENANPAGVNAVRWDTTTSSFVTMVAQPVINTTTANLLGATGAATGLTALAQADLAATSSFRVTLVYRATQ